MTQTINIIGCGRAAGSLVGGWAGLGLVRVGGILNRTEASANQAVRLLGDGDAVARAANLEDAPLWLLGVPDDALSGAAADLSERDFEGAIVFHLAGSLGPDVLEPLSKRGASVAAVHPLKAFSEPTTETVDLGGHWCVADGESTALDRLRPLFEALGARWTTARVHDRALYHAAAAVISNGPRGLVADVTRWLRDAGLGTDEAHGIASSLLLDSARDVQHQRSGLGLTGPVDRADFDTLRRHLEALQQRTDGAEALYRQLSLSVLRLAEAAGQLDDRQVERLMRLFSGNPADP